MELMIAERIKKYRREREMTQEALAHAIGVSAQSVSKWECGDGYPDITLLPSIANFFEVTVDELIGNDEISAKEDVQKNYFNKIRDMDDYDRLELGLKYYRKYPRNWHIATSLMHQIVDNCKDKIEEYRPLLNEIAERILKECTDSVMRRSAVRHMCKICEEDEVAQWLNKDTSYWYDTRYEAYEDRYQHLGDEERHWEWRYAGNLLQTAYMICRLSVHKNYNNAPGESVAFNSMYLSILNGVLNISEGDPVPDGWIPEYYIEYVRLAAAYIAVGEKEKGYLYLEKALELYERWSALPDKAPLDAGNPIFYGRTKLIKNDWRILLPDCEERTFIRGLYHSVADLSELMTRKSGWGWFDTVREEERYKEILEKALALKGD